VERAIRAVVEDLDHLVAYQTDERVGFDGTLLFGPRADGVEDALRCRKADVGEQHRFFEVVPGGVVDLVTAHPGEHTGERGAGAAEPVAQPRLLADWLLEELLQLLRRDDRGDVGNDVGLRREPRFEVGVRLVDRRLGRSGSGPVGGLPLGLGPRRRATGPAARSDRWAKRSASAPPASTTTTATMMTTTITARRLGQGLVGSPTPLPARGR
jgi:hypothetical protein